MCKRVRIEPEVPKSFNIACKAGGGRDLKTTLTANGAICLVLDVEIYYTRRAGRTVKAGSTAFHRGATRAVSAGCGAGRGALTAKVVKLLIRKVFLLYRLHNGAI